MTVKSRFFIFHLTNFVPSISFTWKPETVSQILILHKECLANVAFQLRIALFQLFGMVCKLSASDWIIQLGIYVLWHDEV